MATAHHPEPARIHVSHNFDWLWISLSVILIALIAGTIAWAVFRPAVEVPSLPAEVIGFEYDHEVTTGMAVSPGVTTPYFGYSGELYPEVAAARSLDPGEAASLMRSVDRAIEGSHWSTLSGFELEDDTTSFHIAKPGITADYFGMNPVLDPDK
ncbi:MAG: hypothetical protein ABFS21_08715 [Actinomycetota bacterium]